MHEKEMAHELIKAVLELAQRLGRNPTLTEFKNEYAFGAHNASRVFGSYTQLLNSAGLTNDGIVKKRRLGNEIFARDVEEVVAENPKALIIEQPKYKKILVIGDTHFPFVSHHTLDAIYTDCQRDKPDLMIQVGDLYDMYAHSKFPRSLNVYTPIQEEELGKRGAEEMWKILRETAPLARCIQLKGNHDVRPLKRTLEYQPAIEHAVTEYLNKLMTFEGVELVKDIREEFIIDGIQFLHGYRSNIGDHRDYALMNTVCGHIHRGGTAFRRIRGQTLWELNAGFVGDPHSKALSYTPQKIADYTLGFGRIDELGPRFISL